MGGGDPGSEGVPGEVAPQRSDQMRVGYHLDLSYGCCNRVLGPSWPGQWVRHDTGHGSRSLWRGRGTPSGSQAQLRFLSAGGPSPRSFPGHLFWPRPGLLSQLYLIILSYWMAAIIVSQKAIGVVFKASVRLELGSPGIHGMSFPV